MKQHKPLAKFLSWLVTVLIPPVILMLAIRLMITPVFAQLEYTLPGFPEDPFGFTKEERLRWAEPSINYLVNSEDIGFLKSLRFNNGESIFNERELSHMQDVKNVVRGMRIALASVMVGLLVLTILAEKDGWRDLLLEGCSRGGWGVLGLIGAILIFVALNFSSLFSWFHQLFFESGTWQFNTSDTLIRLFPMRFWQDAFIFVGMLSLILGSLIILFCRKRNTKQFE